MRASKDTSSVDVCLCPPPSVYKRAVISLLHRILSISSSQFISFCPQLSTIKIIRLSTLPLYINLRKLLLYTQDGLRTCSNASYLRLLYQHPSQYLAIPMVKYYYNQIKKPDSYEVRRQLLEQLPAQLLQANLDVRYRTGAASSGGSLQATCRFHYSLHQER